MKTITNTEPSATYDCEDVKVTVGGVPLSAVHTCRSTSRPSGTVELGTALWTPVGYAFNENENDVMFKENHYRVVEKWACRADMTEHWVYDYQSGAGAFHFSDGEVVHKKLLAQIEGNPEYVHNEVEFDDLWCDLIDKWLGGSREYRCADGNDLYYDTDEDPVPAQLLLQINRSSHGS